MDIFPDSILIRIFSFIDWRRRVKLELVSRRWNRVLLDKTLRVLGCVDLDSLVVKSNENTGRQDSPFVDCDDDSNSTLDWGVFTTLGDSITDDESSTQVTLPEAIESLVAKKKKIINQIRSTENDTEALVNVMQTITSVQPEYLKKLKLNIKYNDASGLGQLISLCVNLDDLDMSGYNVFVTLSSQLDQLKKLKGDGVYFKNCRAPNIVDLDYSHVTLNDLENCADFRQMMSTMSRSVEIMSISFMVMCRESVTRPVVIKMPNLKTLALRAATFFNFAIDVSESKCLDSIDMIGNTFVNFDIVNFDLSVHRCLSRFNDNCGASTMVAQLVQSVIAKPEALCSLGTLLVKTITDELFRDLVGSIFPFHTYALHTVRIIHAGRLPPDSTGLVRLVENSPDLTSLLFPSSVISNRFLIELIRSKMRVKGRLYMEVGRIGGCDEIAFLSHLFDGLSSVQASVMNSERKVTVYVLSYNVTINRESHPRYQRFIDLKDSIAEMFNVFVYVRYAP